MPCNFEVSVSNLKFSQTRYGREFQRFPPKFASSKNYARQSFNFPLNIQFFIWSLCWWSPRWFIILLRIWDVARTKSIYISIASLPELKELGKYEYFFRVYHDNEIYRAQTETDLGLDWVKVKRPSTLGSSLAKARG